MAMSQSLVLVTSRRWRRLDAAGIACLGFVLLMVLLILFGPQIAPRSALAFDPLHSLEGPSPAFPFGTDEFGRDIFSRIIAGTRPTLLVALAAAALGVLLGTSTGLVAGYVGGAVDEAVMRVMDTLMSFPGLILAMLVVVMLGPDAMNVVIAIALVFWPRSARLVRSVVLDLATREFIDAARSRGETRLFILARELLPNVLMIIVVDFSLRVTAAILLSASLAYLGIGVTPPTPAWGLMVRDGQQFIELAWWLPVFPSLAIAVVSIGTLLVGERLRRSVATPGGGRPR
ncbi:peptide/nickel transport system permease protein [Humitalea rosea]|uniref:Peptide/nickel transport system permease protein n=2 Tax=Humitalea rosea TaxID=990373 RepID=A0A2W7HVY0_9PROT|nr:peptide/nickel transport system permease protein [Humitalea rosea]